MDYELRRRSRGCPTRPECSRRKRLGSGRTCSRLTSNEPTWCWSSISAEAQVALFAARSEKSRGPSTRKPPESAGWLGPLAMSGSGFVRRADDGPGLGATSIRLGQCSQPSSAGPCRPSLFHVVFWHMNLAYFDGFRTAMLLELMVKASNSFAPDGR